MYVHFYIFVQFCEGPVHSWWTVMYDIVHFYIFVQFCEGPVHSWWTVMYDIVHFCTFLYIKLGHARKHAHVYQSNCTF